MTLGDRMKLYENVSNLRLMRRTPVIIRIDGRAFHSFTRGFKKPFDEDFMSLMEQTMQSLCEQVSNCVLGYVQSDEITLVLIDYADINTQPWFDNRVQKIASVCASTATAAFNQHLYSLMVEKVAYDQDSSLLESKFLKATFDARAFNVPQHEVLNNLIWRQQDATRNSILSVAQSLFPHKEIEGLKCDELKVKMLMEKEVNWDSLPIPMQRGTCCIKSEMGRGWILDHNIPIFTDDTEYINKLIFI